MSSFFLERDSALTHYPTVPGVTLVRAMPGVTLRERTFGQRVATEIFRVRRGTPSFPESSFADEGRLVIQVRAAVGLRMSTADGARFVDRLDQFAIGAFGDPPQHAVSWVQVVRYRRATWETFAGVRETGPAPLETPVDREGFTDREGAWILDTDRRSGTPRYSGTGVAMRPIADPNGEVIYDGPDLSVGAGRWIDERPELRALDVTAQFRTYLCPGRGRPPVWSRIEPLAVVEWAHAERYVRASAGGPVERSSGQRLYWVIPNPPVPPPMREALGAFWTP